MQSTSNTLLKKEFRLLAGGSKYKSIHEVRKSFRKEKQIGALLQIIPNRLLILMIIFGFALLSLGINEGLMSHLTAKMDSPIMRLIEVENNTNRISFNSVPLDSQFQVTQIPRINYWKKTAFVSLPGEERHKADVFFVERHFHDSILTLLQSNKDNFTSGIKDFNYRAGHPASIIISEVFAKKSGFLSNPGIGYLRINQFNIADDDSTKGIHFPVAAVMKKLPKNADIIITESTWSVLKSPLDASDYKNCFSKDCFLISPMDTTRAQDEYSYSSFERAPTIDESYVIAIQSREVPESWPKIEFIPFDLTIKPRNRLSENVIFRYTSGTFIYFPKEGLTSLPGKFAQALESGFEQLKTDKDPIQLNLTDIESKRNLGIISGLTRILTLAITILALGFVISFVVNLLIQHIAHNGPNIGTLQAFGISNNYIILLYTKIGLMLISIAFLAGLLLSLIIGPWAMDLILAQIGLGSESEHISFTLGNLPLIGAAFIALPISVVYLTLRKKLSNSKPGDLIYSRNNSTQQ